MLVLCQKHKWGERQNVRNQLHSGYRNDAHNLACARLSPVSGKFPFEGDSVSTMAVTDPMKKIWLQQNKTSWNNNATLRDQLPFMSPEAKDLLDRIFELDEQKRIDVRSIKMHPWFQVGFWGP